MTSYLQFYKEKVEKLLEEFGDFFTDEEKKDMREEKTKESLASLCDQVQAVPGLTVALSRSYDERPPHTIKAIMDFIPTMRLLRQDTSRLEFFERAQKLPLNDQKRLCAYFAAFYGLSKSAREKSKQ